VKWRKIRGRYCDAVCMRFACEQGGVNNIAAKLSTATQQYRAIDIDREKESIRNKLEGNIAYTYKERERDMGGWLVGGCNKYNIV